MRDVKDIRGNSVALHGGGDGGPTDIVVQKMMRVAAWAKAPEFGAISKRQ